MNPKLFPHLSELIIEAFESSEWQDGVAVAFRNKQLQHIEEEMKKSSLLIEDIEMFVDQAEQLICS